MLVQCPHCSTQVTNDASLAGQTVTCPACRGQFQMPVPVGTISQDPLQELTESVASSRRRRRRQGTNSSIIAILVVSLILLAAVGIGIVLYTTGVISSPGAQEEAAAKEVLKTALDSWVFREPYGKLEKTHPEIAFFVDMNEANYNYTLQKYEIGACRKEKLKGEDGIAYVFSVILTLETTNQFGPATPATRIRMYRVYQDRSNRWHIFGTAPGELNAPVQE